MSGSSAAVTRAIRPLSSGRPGTIAGASARSATASSRRSSRRSACRASPSGPWHSKQLADRIGRMSRLKSTSAAGDRSSCREYTDQRNRRIKRAQQRQEHRAGWHGRCPRGANLGWRRTFPAENRGKTAKPILNPLAPLCTSKLRHAPNSFRHPARTAAPTRPRSSETVANLHALVDALSYSWRSVHRGQQSCKTYAPHSVGGPSSTSCDAPGVWWPISECQGAGNSPR